MQFSLFGAEVAEPTPGDLDGVLLAGGRWVRTSAGARLSVVVATRWRADALAADSAARGLADDEPVVPAVDGLAVRTPFSPELAAPAARWIRGAHEGPPRDLELTAGGLRLWALASGRRDDAGFLLGTARPDDATHHAAGAQLSRLGVAAVSLARGGPGWRVTSVRRVRRLAELLGPPPAGAEEHWPRP